MVASSSNLLLVASSPRENRHGYMIRSTSTNNISGISGTNLKDTIMLETVAAPVYASATSASATSASTTPPSATKSEEKPRPRPRPRRKKMVSTGVDTMKKMLVTSSSVVVALPESPTVMVSSRKHECGGEQRDDIESAFNNIRSTSTRKVLSFSMETPSMPDMILMPSLPAPDVNRNSKLTNEMSNNDNTAPMKNEKKKNHMGRRLRQLKKRLSYKSKSGSNKSSSSNQVEEQEEVCLSHGTTATTSATTSTLSFGPSSSEEHDVPFTDTMDMMTMNMTTTLQPRVRSMFHEEEEMMMPMMPVLSALPCPLSSSTDDAAVVAVTTIPLASFYSKLDKALSVFSPNEGDDDDGDDDVGADDTDEWGVFASYDDEKEEEHHKSEDQTHNDHHKFKPFSRSSFTKHTSNPCFQPRAHLPVVFAATAAGAE